MNFIIQDMLDFAQIKNDKFRHNYKEFNVREAIEKVMCIQRQKAKDKDLDFNVKFINIGEDPEGSLTEYSPHIYCDEHRIMQVLLGLQVNALKFTQKGKVETLVQIITKDKDHKFL